MKRPRRFWRRPAAWLALGALLAVGGSSVALAQVTELGGKIRSGDQVVVPAGETVAGDLYASGGIVRVEGTVDGDLVAAGGQVQVAGEVTGDLLAGSGNVDVSGQVGGDVRVGAGQVTITGSVGEDLVAGAGQITITSSGQVGEDLIFASGQTTLDGRVSGDVLGATGQYSRGGTVGGIERVTITERDEKAAPDAADRVLGALARFIGLLAVAALLLWLLPRVIEGTALTLRGRPWLSLAVGALGMVGFVLGVLAVILVMILLAILFGLIGLGGLVGTTIFGSVVLLAVLAFLFFMAVAYVAPAAVGMWLGRLALGPEAGLRRWGALALGVLAVVVVTSIPIVGGWIAFVIVLFGLGALLLEINPWRRPAPAGPATPPPPPPPPAG